jgi:hypothetical protein
MTSKNSTCLKQSYQSIGKNIKGIHFNRHSLESGFKQRKEQKLTGKLLLISFFLMALQGDNSFQLWAEKISRVSGIWVSKQAVWKRITERYTKFLMAVLQEAMGAQISGRKMVSKDSLLKNRYKRILIQDSTCIALPACLRWCFPGNTSNGERKAQLKIQVVYDLINNQFVYFELTPFTVNDQSQSKNILFIAQKGDLVIRDLGYFSLGCFDQLCSGDIDFVSRLRYGIKIADVQNGKQINLLSHLRAKGTFDRWVQLGEDQKAIVRLIAVPLNQEQASRKRYKAKHDRDMRLNHSKEYYEQLGYSIYITNEEKETYSAMQIIKLYGLRWRIETIFKCWKSHFNFQKLIPSAGPIIKERAQAIIYMMLIFCLLFQLTVYNYLLANSRNFIVSLTKMCKFIANNLDLFFQYNLKTLAPGILRYCSYEIRKDRLNFYQKQNLG